MEQVMECLSGELWSQLLGGRHVRVGGGERGWGGLCTAIEKCADEAQSIVSKVDAASSRVVLICDGIRESDTCAIAHNFLSRPRLFHRAVLVITADLSSMSDRSPHPRHLVSFVPTPQLRLSTYHSACLPFIPFKHPTPTKSLLPLQPLPAVSSSRYPAMRIAPEIS